MRGTLIPCADLKCLIAAPAAVSSYILVSDDRKSRKPDMRSFYLNYRFPIFCDLGIDNNVKIQSLILHYPFHS